MKPKDKPISYAALREHIDKRIAELRSFPDYAKPEDSGIRERVNELYQLCSWMARTKLLRPAAPGEPR